VGVVKLCIGFGWLKLPLGTVSHWKPWN